jgi:hypothetical protein
MNRAVEIYREVFCTGPHFTDSMAMWCAGLPEDLATRADYKAEFGELLQVYYESHGHRNFAAHRKEATTSDKAMEFVCKKSRRIIEG